MKIVILGAAGRAGRAVLAALMPLPGVEKVFLADGDVEALTRMASQPAPFPLYMRYLEAADHRCLRERLAEADLALGCLGPFHLHEADIFRAALEAGCDYLTLCDDAQTTSELLSRREEAEAGSSRMLLGCGMTPGLSNLLALQAASRLDRVERLRFFWRLEGLWALGWASLRQLARSLSGRAAVVREGREERVRAGGWAEVVDFPPPAGLTIAVFLHRPEPLTLTRVVKGVRESFFKGGMGDRGEDLILQALSRLGEEGYVEALLNILRLAGGRALASRRDGPCRSFLRVTAEGFRGGRPYRVHLATAGDYYRVTGAMAAAAVAWLRSADPPPGVYTPEEAIDGEYSLPFLEASGARFFQAEETSP